MHRIDDLANEGVFTEFSTRVQTWVEQCRHINVEIMLEVVFADPNFDPNNCDLCDLDDSVSRFIVPLMGPSHLLFKNYLGHERSIASLYLGDFVEFTEATYGFLQDQRFCIMKVRYL